MQRIRVDLPEPDGPQITTRSPLRTLRLMSASTSNVPNHLKRPLISTARPADLPSVSLTRSEGSCMAAPSPPLGPRKPVFDAVRVAGHQETEHEIEHGRKRVAGRAC